MSGSRAGGRQEGRAGKLCHCPSYFSTEGSYDITSALLPDLSICRHSAALNQFLWCNPVHIHLCHCQISFMQCGQALDAKKTQWAAARRSHFWFLRAMNVGFVSLKGGRSDCSRKKRVFSCLRFIFVFVFFFFFFFPLAWFTDKEAEWLHGNDPREASCVWHEPQRSVKVKTSVFPSTCVLLNNVFHEACHLHVAVLTVFVLLFVAFTR